MKKVKKHKIPEHEWREDLAQALAYSQELLQYAAYEKAIAAQDEYNRIVKDDKDEQYV